MKLYKFAWQFKTVTNTYHGSSLVMADDPTRALQVVREKLGPEVEVAVSPWTYEPEEVISLEIKTDPYRD